MSVGFLSLGVHFCFTDLPYNIEFPITLLVIEPRQSVGHGSSVRVRLACKTRLQ